MFFSKRKRRKQLEKDLASYKNIVQILTNAIYKMDEVIQKMLTHGDCSYNSISYIYRSMQDILNAISVYKGNRFTHAYYESCLSELQINMRKIVESLDEYGKQLCIAVKNFKITKDGLEDIEREQNVLDIDSESLENIHANMLNLSLSAKRLTFLIHEELIDLRSALYTLRWITSTDYIIILSGADIIEMYEYYEERYQNEIRCEIRFDKKTITREYIKSNKEETL